MKIRTESQARAWMRDAMKPWTTRGDFVFQPIETSSTANGVPDVWYAAKGGAQGWIEFKCVSLNEAMVTRIPWRPGQLEWLARAERAGVKCWLFLFVKNVGILHCVPSPSREWFSWHDLEYSPAVYRHDTTRRVGHDVYLMLGGR